MRILFLTVLGFGLLALGVGLYSIYDYKTPRTYPAMTLVIPPHTSSRTIVAQLHDAGLVPPLPLMAMPMVLAGAKGQLKAGEYQFESGLSPAQIIAKIKHGDIVIHKVVIPEGWNSFQLRAALTAEPLLSGTLPDSIAEGSAFPDTMNFTRGEPRQAVLTRMQTARDTVLADLWSHRDANLPFTTPQQALILASIVEKETGVRDERALVAGVFVNRLRLGMMLQSDPTVAYGIMVAQGGAAMARPLTLADLKTDTPYNSYTRTGLPPTPICNPGRDALYATLHPAATDALYFVATGHGGHHFAATLAEHERNVAEYRAHLQSAGH